MWSHSVYSIVRVLFFVDFSSFDFQRRILALVLGQQHASLHQSAGEQQRWERVGTSKFIETNNAVYCNTIDEQNDGRQHLNLQLLNEERSALSVHAHKSSFNVRLSNFVQVHVNDFASLKVFVEKGANHIVCLGHRWQELTLENFVVGAVTESFVGLRRLVIHAHLCYALLAKSLHDFSVVTEIIVEVFVAIFRERLFAAFIFQAPLGAVFFLVHLLFNHCRFILDGLVHHHVLENLALKLHV